MKTLLSLLLALPLSVGAATFHVKTTGNDTTGDGSEGNPWLTINKGLTTMAASDTLTIWAGTYAERMSSSAMKAGSSGNPTIIKRNASDTVWLIPAAASDNVVTFGSGDSYIRLDGLSLSATNVTGGQNAVKITDGANNIEIINCPQIGHVMDGHGILISEGSGGTGGILLSNNVVSDIRYISGSDNHIVYVSGLVTNVTIKNNALHTGSMANSHVVHCFGGQYSDVEVSGNTIHSAQRGIGFYTATNSSSLAYNNVIYSNVNGIRITFNAGGVRLLNNTVWKNTQHGIEIGSTALTNEVVNNVTVSNSNRGLSIASGTAVTTVTNNLIVDNVLGNLSNSDSDTVLSGNITDNAADPALTDPENGDFTIGTSSAARNAGISLSATFTIDKAGTSRPQESVWDIGAFEFPAAAPNVTVSIEATDAIASEADLDPGTFTVTRNGSTSGALTVNFALTGSTATSGVDYTSIGTSVVIGDGNATATITVTPLQDALVEGDETVKVTISADAAYTVGSPDNATVTIRDNDGQPSVVLRGN